ncbi:MAG: NAD(P)-dependent alcohol dehydrogenase [Gemmatimonadales bacterium]
MPISAYAAKNKGAKLDPYTFEPGPLGQQDVEVRVTHCGICHSDVHMIDNDWGLSSFPLVPGHEIVGTITARGSSVENLKVGQRVGIGWLAGTCMNCEWCNEGSENLCAMWQPTCVGRPGGFADKVRADSRWTFAIPDELPSAEAAPLLCAGITVFTPLVDYGAAKGKKVGVVSVGGLGHLAVQFATAMGADVTAFSTSKSKRDEARQFGAQNFVDIGDSEAIAGAANTQDLILSTASADLPWDALVGALRPKGVLCILGVPENQVSLAAFPLLAGHKKVVGSNTGNRKMMEKMLQFAAKHRIFPTIQRYPMSQVNDAIGTLRDQTVRYRAVLEA